MPVATWLFSRVVPKGERESLLGDLTEEYTLRVTASASAARRWYLRQLCASTPPLLWIRLTRGTWPATLGVALLAYAAVGVAQVVIHLAMANSATALYNPLGVIGVFPPVVLIAYCAERCRRGSAGVLAAMMLLAITAMTLWASENAPLWYRMAFFFLGPAAACLGAALRRATR